MATVNCTCHCLAPTRDDGLQERRQVGHRLRADLRVDADRETQIAPPAQRVERAIERAGDVADLIVQRPHPVERHADAVEAGVDGLLQALRGEVAAAGLDRAIDPRAR